MRTRVLQISSSGSVYGPRVQHHEVGGAARSIIPAGVGAVEGVQRLAHGPLTDGVHVHLEAAPVQPGHVLPDAGRSTYDRPVPPWPRYGSSVRPRPRPPGAGRRQADGPEPAYEPATRPAGPCDPQGEQMMRLGVQQGGLQVRLGGPRGRRPTRSMAPSCSTPVGVPSGSRSMRLSAGSGVPRVTPAGSRARVLTQGGVVLALDQVGGTVQEVELLAPGKADMSQPPPSIRGRAGFASAWARMTPRRSWSPYTPDRSHRDCSGPNTRPPRKRMFMRCDASPSGQAGGETRR